MIVKIENGVVKHIDIDIYDMLVFDDESGSIYQDCITEMRFVDDFQIYKGNCCKITICGNNIMCEWDGVGIVNLFEVWARQDADTYKKTYMRG